MPDFSRHSVFLWGPRKTGKSFWIKQHLPEAIIIDLLRTDTLAEYVTRPALLRERFGTTVPLHNPGPIVIDEIQKVPALLDEVHWLIENRALTFLLTGSSARKLRRGHANLLAGRAWRREMKPLCFAEVEEIDIERVMVSGLLPPHFLSPAPREDLRAYVSDYLREEIIAEGLVSNLPAFSEFLRVAALTSSELLNYTNVAREVGVSAKVVRSYFEILEDTLLGYRLRPWTRSSRRRLIQAEKFYLFDVGVTTYLTRRTPRIGTPEFGKSFEHYLFMELLAYRAYRAPELDIRYWRTSTGREVDFLLDDQALAIEVKASARVHAVDWQSLSALSEEGLVRQRIVVSLETQPREVQDRFGPIMILPWREFLAQLWSGVLLR
ncbi:MAG: ATP-binding protein [Terriglobia bacterium]